MEHKSDGDNHARVELSTVRPSYTFTRQEEQEREEPCCFSLSPFLPSRPPSFSPSLNSFPLPSFALLQIAFTTEDLYDKEKVDIEHVVMEEVMILLQ